MNAFAALIAGGLIAWLLKKWSTMATADKPTPTAGDVEFQALLVDAAAEWLSRHLGLSRAAARSQIESSLRGPDAALRSIVRIDYQVEKRSANRVGVWMSVLVEPADDGKARLGRVECECDWDTVPQPVRAELIRHPDRKPTYVLFEREQVAREPARG